MKVSLYSTLFGAASPRGSSFDVPGALANWAVYADEIVVACGDEPSEAMVVASAARVGVTAKVKTIRTSFDFTTDPFAYGKTENAALQGCTGDLLLQANMDERWLVGDPSRLSTIYSYLKDSNVPALWVPTVDLYGSMDRCLPKVGAKWYIALGNMGLQRGPVRQGIKPDGKPDYNITSSDELLDRNGNLVQAARVVADYSLETVRRYVADGWPITFHTGYLDLGDRLERSLWWKSFWEKATGGDPNKHPTSLAELADRETVEHGLPMWPTIQTSTL